MIVIILSYTIIVTVYSMFGIFLPQKYLYSTYHCILEYFGINLQKLLVNYCKKSKKQSNIDCKYIFLQ